MTCCIALVGYFTLVNFPDSASTHKRFLTAEELRFCIARINADRADAIPEAWSLKKYLTPALDLKIWGFAFIFGFTTTVTYALAYFLPINGIHCWTEPMFGGSSICCCCNLDVRNRLVW
jgi:hypothetical protein